MTRPIPEASFLPHMVRQRLRADPRVPAAPTADVFTGAVALLDLSGFSALASGLASAGPEGAERLIHALDVAFAALLDVVDETGGDAITFAGDAVIAVWPAEDGGEAAAVHAAVTAAFSALSRIHASQAEGMSLHAGVSVGTVRLLHTPDASGDWLVTLAGQPLDEAGAALDPTDAGQVCLSPGAWALVAHELPGAVDEEGRGWPSEPSSHTLHEAGRPPLLDVAPDVMRAYVPLPARDRLAVGHDAWLGELRQTTSVFLSLDGWPDAPEAQLAWTGQVVEVLEPVFRAVGAWFRGVLVDDKGATAIAFFGTPGSVFEDAPKRALQASVRARHALGRVGVGSRAGVGTGPAFCGAVGTLSRRDYTIIGDAVNLAARLAALARDEVLCDRDTATGARGAVHLEALPPRRIKGQTEAVATFRVAAGATPSSARQVPTRVGQLVGRATERDALVMSLGRLEAGQPVRWWIEGEAGIGKSHLVEDVAQVARQRGLRVITTTCDAAERSAAARALRPIARELVEDVVGAGGIGVRALTDALADAPELLARLPLLRALGLLDLEDSAFTASMTGDVRARNLASLLVGIAGRREGPRLFVIEDAHWMDAVSWTVLEAMLAERPDLGLLLSARPLERDAEAARHGIDRLGMSRMPLGGLDAAGARALFVATLGVQDVPEGLFEVANERAQGNPFFISEIARALVDSDLLRIEGHSAVLVDTQRGLASLSVPTTVEAVVTSRIDRLPARHQLTLKVASVIGRSFAFRTIDHVHPVQQDRPQLPTVLDELRSRDLTDLENADPNLTYAFKHALTRDVAYGLLPLDRRRVLHQAVADWLIALQASEGVPSEALVAYHCGLAGDTEAQAHWLLEAARAADQIGASYEVETLAQAALDLIAEGRAAAHTDRVADLHLLLGGSQYAIGRFEAAATHLRAALAGMGAPLGTTGLGRLGHVAALVTRFALARWGLCRLRGRPDLSAPRREQLGAAVERLGQVSYVLKDNLTFIESLLVALEALTPHGLTVQLGRLQAGTTVLAQMVGLTGIAEDYDRRGAEALKLLDDQSALGWIAEVRGMYALGEGRLDDAVLSLSQSVATFDAMGHVHGASEAESLWLYACLAQGDLEAALLHLEARMAYGTAQRNSYVLCHGHTVHACIAGLRGDLAGVRRHVELVRAHPDPANDEHALNLAVAEAWAACLGQDVDGARVAVREALVVQTRVPPTLVYMLPQCSMLAYVATTLVAAPGATSADRRAARKAVAALVRFSRTFALGRATALRAKGALAAALGRPRAAERSLRQAAEVAAASGQSLEQGLALLRWHRLNPAAGVGDQALSLLAAAGVSVPVLTQALPPQGAGASSR